MSEWVLVPKTLKNEMAAAWFTSAYVTIDNRYNEMLAARPPIPRAVWDAMVERGARAIYEIGRSGAMSEWPARTAQYKTTFLSDAETALRAALGNPVVEGDAS